MLKTDKDHSQSVRSIEAVGALAYPSRTFEMRIRQGYVVAVPEVTVLPRQILIKDRYLLPDTFRRYDPSLKHDFLEKESGSLRFRPPKDLTPTLTVEAPSFYFDGEHVNHYGHFTLEIISRLWSFPNIDLRELVFVTSHADLGFVAQFLEPFSVSKSQLLQITGVTQCSKLIISSQSYILERQISDVAYPVYDRIGAYYHTKDYDKKIYVSRSRFKGQRNLLNESDVEDLFRKEGYTVVYPEQLDVRDQISIFAGATHIAGPSGSSMYNLVYSKNKSHVVILVSNKFITKNDALINAGSDCQIRYVVGKAVDNGKTGMASDWIVDLDVVAASIRV